MTRYLLPMFVLVSACHQAAPPTPPVELPVLERPVVSLAAPAKGLLQAPRGSILERNGLKGVFVLRDGHARFQLVKLGRARGARVETLSGLAGGESLVGGSLAELRDGSPISVVPRS